MLRFIEIIAFNWIEYNLYSLRKFSKKNEILSNSVESKQMCWLSFREQGRLKYLRNESFSLPIFSKRVKIFKNNLLVYCIKNFLWMIQEFPVKLIIKGLISLFYSNKLCYSHECTLATLLPFEITFS